MLDIRVGDKGEIVLAGRFDASQAVKAETFMAALTESRVVDLGGLEYISSLGLGVLLATQKRLMASGHALKLINVRGHVREV
jgi:anti-sigma B factor antagonist